MIAATSLRKTREKAKRKKKKRHDERSFVATKLRYSPLSLSLYFAFDPCAVTANLAAVKDISVISTKTKEQRVPAIIYVGVVFGREDD